MMKHKRVNSNRKKGFWIYYLLGPFYGKPRYRYISFDMIEREENHIHSNIKTSELCIRYPEFACKILSDVTIKNIPQDDVSLFIESVLERLDILISRGENIPIESLWGIIKEVSVNDLLKSKTNNVWGIIPTKSHPHKPLVQETRKNGKVIAILWRAQKTLRENSIDVHKKSPIPPDLLPIIHPAYPIRFGSLSITELLPVVEKIKQFVENPYDIEVLRSFRDRVYDTVYRSSWIEQNSYEWFDDIEGEMEIKLSELGIPSLWEHGSIFNIWNNFENTHLQKKWVPTAEAIANIVLLRFDKMMKELRENPQKMNDPEFKKTLDEEIATLSQIIWSDREDSPLRINELTQRKNEASDPAPLHLMPALWYSIQVDVMSVRLNEQRIYITENLKTRRNRKLQLDKIHCDTQTEWIFEQMNDIKKHYADMERFYDIVHQGSLRYKWGTRHIPRPLRAPEMRNFRNALAQFDSIYTSLSQKNDWNELLLWFSL